MIKKTLLIIILALSSCADKHNPMDNVRFNHKQLYNFNVASIDIIDNASIDEFDIDREVDMAVNIWAKDRLQASGEQDYRFKLIINRASIKEKILPSKENFTHDQILYNLEMDVKFELYEKDPLLPKAEMNISINRSKSIEENKPIYEKKLLRHQLVSEAITAFDLEFDKNFAKYFSNIVQIN